MRNAGTNDNNIHTGRQPGHTNVYVYCEENDTPSNFKAEGDLCEGDTGAYTWDSLGWFWSNHMVVLCPNNYFDETKTSTLAAQLQAVRRDPSKASDISSIYWNLGSIYLNETFLWKDTVTNPKAYDFDPDDHNKIVYGPQAATDEAASKKTYANSVIADAYTMAASASMLMQTFRLGDVPQPLSVSAASGIQTHNFDNVTQDWTGPQNVNDPNSLPDMTQWQNSTKGTIIMTDYQPISSSTATPTPTPTPSGTQPAKATKSKYPASPAHSPPARLTQASSARRATKQMALPAASHV